MPERPSGQPRGNQRWATFLSNQYSAQIPDRPRPLPLSGDQISAVAPMEGAAGGKS